MQIVGGKKYENIKDKQTKFCSRICNNKFRVKNPKLYNQAGFQKGHGYIGGGTPKGMRVSPKSEFKKGSTPWNKGVFGVMKAWNKGLGTGARSVRQKEINHPKYAKWRITVFERDDYTCQKCKERGGRLVADHIKMWSLYPRLRYKVENGQTLCKDCHSEKTKKELKLFWKNQYAVSKNLK